VGGTFTATAGTTSVVAQPAIQSQSTVSIIPTNSAASTLVKTDGYFITQTVGTGFTVTFGGSAAGTETFNYLVNTPTEFCRLRRGNIKEIMPLQKGNSSKTI